MSHESWHIFIFKFHSSCTLNSKSLFIQDSVISVFFRFLQNVTKSMKSHLMAYLHFRVDLNAKRWYNALISRCFRWLMGRMVEKMNFSWTFINYAFQSRERNDFCSSRYENWNPKSEPLLLFNILWQIFNPNRDYWKNVFSQTRKIGTVWSRRKWDHRIFSRIIGLSKELYFNVFS